MSTDTMSTTDNQVLTDILNTLQGLSPPAILTTMSDSLDTLNGSIKAVKLAVTDFNKAFTDFNKAFTDFNKAFTGFAKDVLKKLEPTWWLEILNLAIGAGSLGVGVYGAVKAAGAMAGAGAGGALGGSIAIGNILSKLGILGLILAGIILIGVLLSHLPTNTSKNIPVGSHQYANMFEYGATMSREPITSKAVNTVKKSTKAVDNKWTKQVLPDLNDRAGTNKLIPKAFRPQAVTPTNANPTIPLGVSKTTERLLNNTNSTNTMFNGSIPYTKDYSVPFSNQTATPMFDIFGKPQKKSFSNPSSVIKKVSPTIPLASTSTKQVASPITKQVTATVVNMPNNEDLVSNNKIVNANFTTSMFSNNSSNGGTKGATSSTSNATNNYQTVYNIANIDIADGMISDLEDLIQAINRHAC